MNLLALLSISFGAGAWLHAGWCLAETTLHKREIARLRVRLAPFQRAKGPKGRFVKAEG